MFGGLPLASRGPLVCAVWAVDLTSGQVLGHAPFDNYVEELFDLVALPGVRNPEIAEPGSERSANLWFLPKSLVKDRQRS